MIRAPRTARPARVRARRGFTLPELALAMVMLTIVMGSMTSVILKVQRDYIRQRNQINSVDALRTTELLLTRVMRTARANPLAVANLTSITPDPLAHGVFDNVRVRSDFNPADGDVADPLEDVLVSVANDTLRIRWTAGASTEPVVFPVSDLRFAYFTADGTAVTTADVSTAKRVRMTIDVPIVTANGGTTTRRTIAWAYLRN
jgi:prepilin-type N-terminal cleavage/methylation domain-containing protein